MSDQLNNLPEIIAFFKWVSASEVQEQTTINNDLELVGFDADHMLEEFIARFKVDMTGFPYEEYFLDEMGLEYYYYKFFKKEKLLKKPLTVAHMAKVAAQGFWSAPE